MSNTRREKMQRFSHFIMGFVILIHAIGHYTENSHLYPMFFISGIVFISVAIFHEKLIKKFSHIDHTFHIIEAILAFTVAIEYFELGKKFIPVLWVFAGIMQLVAIFIKNNKATKK